MKFFIRLIIVLCLLPPAAADAQMLAETPEYRLRLVPEGSQVDVRLEIAVSEPSSIHLLFRGEWGGYPGLASRLQRLEAYGPAGPLPVETKREDIDSGHRRVQVDQPGLVTITYAMVMTPPNESRLYHRVSQLSIEGGHFIGRDLLPRVWLNRPQSGPHPVRVRIDGMPRNWRAATVADRSGTSYSFPDIGEAVIFVGPLRSQRFNIGQRSMTTALYGRWPVDDPRIVDAIERIAGALHRIAGAGWVAGDYILGTGRVPTGVPGLSTGGQVIGRSGMVYVGGSGPGRLEYERWLHTTSHELMHWYVPTAFSFEGRAPSWFAEGFTDYFSLKILLAGELISPDDFLREVGDRFSRYRGSPLYGATSMADAQSDFWEDDSYRYIYDGGAIAAFMLDLGFQARGGSLERVLTDVRESGMISEETLIVGLASVRENEWLAEWLSGGANPDWATELARYRLHWDGEKLTSTDGWATGVLSSIRP